MHLQRAMRCICKELGSGFAVRWMGTRSMVMAMMSECFFLTLECPLHVNYLDRCVTAFACGCWVLFAVAHCTCSFETSSHGLMCSTRATFDCFRHHSSMLLM